MCVRGSSDVFWKRESRGWVLGCGGVEEEGFAQCVCFLILSRVVGFAEAVSRLFLSQGVTAIRRAMNEAWTLCAVHFVVACVT